MADGSSRSADQPSSTRETTRPVTRRGFLAGGAAFLATLGMRSRTANASPESPGGPPSYEEEDMTSSQKVERQADSTSPSLPGSKPIDLSDSKPE